MPVKQGGGLLRLVAGNWPGPWWLGPLRAVAWGGSKLYGLGAWLDRASYDLHWRQRGKLDAPVISVGNITIGGTGKTPLTMAVARAIAEMGRQPAVISRGYGGNSDADVAWVWRGGELVGNAKQCGDEPVLMAKRLKIPVAVGRDRCQVGRVVLSQYPDAVLVGDDMFQHHRLHRDLDIVAVDALDPLGGGAMLPRGLLREPSARLRRAGVIIQTRADDAEATIKSRRLLRGICGSDIPIIAARHIISGFEGADGSFSRPSAMAGKKAFAFCGLADPEQFGRGLEKLGIGLAGLEPFGDHHSYTREDLAIIEKKATIANADCLICSEKDWVKLQGMEFGKLPLLVARLEMKFEDQGEALRQALSRVLL